MAVIGTFSSFTTARLAIYASQASLNVTGNNIANINTPGYTRQRMDLVSLYSYGSAKFANIYNTNIGYGVLTNGASQLRDPFLDIRYRDENNKLEQSSEWLDGLTQMSRVLDEVNKTKQNDGFGVIEAQLGNLKDALQKLANQESFQEPDTLVRAEAETLTKYFKQAAQELETIYNGKREELDDAVGDINKLLIDIRDLNDKIRTQSIYGDKALELRDARNLALDKLSGLMNIDVTYSMERIDQFTEVEKLTVTIADSKGADGKPIKLVDGIYAGQISIPTKEPVLNPNADAMKILEAKEKALEDAKAANAVDKEPWATQFEEAQNDAAKAQARADAEAANKKDETPWKERFENEVKEAVDAARAKAEKEFKDDPDKDTKVAEAVAAAEQEAQQKIDNGEGKTNEAWEKAVQAEADQTIKDAVRAIEKERQAQIKEDAENDPNIQTAIETYGKYLKTDGTTATNELYKTYTTDDGLVVNELDEKGNPIYLDDVMVYDNDKFIVQVEPLRDERDRLMIDPYTASKRSEVVELGDNVLAGKLQAIRELLTEEGEYASKQDLGKTGEKRLSDDPEAAIKRGIPYYRKALDTLARQIADQFNQMNQMDPKDVYQMSEKQVYVKDGAVDYNPTADSVAETPFLKSKDPDVYLTDAGGKLVTSERMERDQADMAALKAEMDKYTVFPLDVAELKDADGNPLPGAVSEPLLDEEGNPLVDEEGNPLMSDPVTFLSSEQIAENLDALQKKWDAANADLLACKQALQDTGLKDPLYEYYDGGVLFSNGGNNNDPSNITASNISIAVDWAEGPVRVLRSKQPDFYDKDGNVIPNSSRFDNITDIIERYDKQLDYFAQEIQPDAEQPQAMFHGSFREVFTAISAKLGVDGSATTGKVMSYELMTLDLENDRQSVSGVDLNEEATSMMQFSKSYAAACKLLTTLDSMLDKLINGTI